MLTRLSSGWTVTGMPGRIFGTVKGAFLAVAWSPQALPETRALLTDKAKQALKAGAYAGERPLIQALFESSDEWKRLGDEDKAARARAAAEELLHGRTEKPSESLSFTPTPKGFQVRMNEQGLITLPTEQMAKEFISQYQQALGDEDLEKSVYDDFKGRAREARGLPREEPKEAPVVPYWQTPEYKERQRQKELEEKRAPKMRAPASQGEEGEEDERETFQMGAFRIEAEKKTQWYPKKPKPGAPIDKKTGKPKAELGKRLLRVFDVFKADGEVPVYHFWYQGKGRFSVKSNLQEKTKQVQPKVMVRSETLDAIKAKNPALVSHKPDWKSWEPAELAKIAKSLDIAPVYREDPDLRNRITVPDWSAEPPRSAAEVMSLLSAMAKSPDAAGTLYGLMGFLEVGARTANAKVVVKAAGVKVELSKPIG